MKESFLLKHINEEVSSKNFNQIVENLFSEKDLNSNNLFKNSSITQDKNIVRIDKSKIQHIDKGNLFYPCSYLDVIEPLYFLSSFINNFTFCDKYTDINLIQNFLINSLSKNSNIQSQWYKMRKIRFSSKLDKNTLTNSNFDDIAKKSSKERNLNFSKLFSVVKELSVKIKTQDQNYKITQRKGNGYMGLLTSKQNFDVFFYRRDSMGEGGSNCHWLNYPSFNAVLYKLNDKGLIITDGSNLIRNSNKFLINKNFIENYYDTLKNPSIEKMIKIDKYGNKFEIIGNIKQENGFSLIWQVSKIENLEFDTEFIKDFMKGFERFTNQKSELDIITSVNNLKSMYSVIK